MDTYLLVVVCYFLFVFYYFSPLLLEWNESKLAIFIKIYTTRCKLILFFWKNDMKKVLNYPSYPNYV